MIWVIAFISKTFSNIHNIEGMQTVTTKTNASQNGYPSNSKGLKLNGYPVIQSCTEIRSGRGFTFVEENMLLFVRQGAFKFRYGKTEYVIEKDQMAFLRKDILVEYPACSQSGCPVKVEYIRIFLTYELVKEFIKLTQLCITNQEEISPVTVNIIDRRLLKFIDSLEPYFNEPEKIEGNLIKIKLLELLFNLGSVDKKMLVQLMDLRQHFRTDITATVEENIMNSMSLSQLAVKSGRSLSSFRRDFLAIYNMPPSQWIRQRRLEKAQELLLNTTMTITDVCYTLGFENLAHFSRLFKSRFGHSPSGFKLAPILA
jgi:AraC family transcriptional regulator, exoenzyme S synthesis regulatory protein ExsA